MKKSALRFASLIVISALTGCAAPKPYISPTSGDTAKIRVINNSMGTSDVSATTTCGVSSAKSIASFSTFYKVDKSRADMYGSQEYENKSNVIERVVEAEKDTNFFAGYQGASTNICIVGTAFTPRKNQQYEMRFLGGIGGCSLTVVKLSVVDGQIVKEKINDLHPAKKTCE
ncbi:hypothetical protein [Collimonas fungivorans]|uniref:hypothetical protein n=1 Tax=Collimonas fungivorans TaxID=158899 RepID=UPI003FA3D195